jgi:hypothetical protein
MQDSNVTKRVRDFCSRDVENPSGKVEQSGAFTEIDLAILEALEEFPFPSVRQNARMALLPKNLDCHDLTHSLGFWARHLHRIPHALSQTQRVMWIQKSREMLEMLLALRSNSIHEILVLDQS